MDVEVEDDFLPNVYVARCCSGRSTTRNIPLMAGHGFAPLMVEKTSNKLAVTITAPDKIRPKTRQTVTVNAGGEKDVYVTLAAVDEGICQVKNYKTPDPYGYFYAKKALETETFDFFKHLIPEPEKAARSSPGGGDDAAMAKRVNPLGVQRFKPLALWSGILRTGTAGGRLNVPLDIPEFSGELRLMALAYKGDRFGSAQQAMKVADPVVITPALPRFLSPGDSVLSCRSRRSTRQRSRGSLSLEIVTSGGLVAATRTAALKVVRTRSGSCDVPLRATTRSARQRSPCGPSHSVRSLESVTETPRPPAAPFAAEAITGFVEGGCSVSHDVTDAFFRAGRQAYLRSARSRSPTSPAS